MDQEDLSGCRIPKHIYIHIDEKNSIRGYKVARQHFKPPPPRFLVPMKTEYLEELKDLSRLMQRSNFRG